MKTEIDITPQNRLCKGTLSHNMAFHAPDVTWGECNGKIHYRDRHFLNRHIRTRHTFEKPFHVIFVKNDLGAKIIWSLIRKICMVTKTEKKPPERKRK